MFLMFLIFANCPSSIKELITRDINSEIENILSSPVLDEKTSSYIKSLVASGSDLQKFSDRNLYVNRTGFASVLGIFPGEFNDSSIIRLTYAFRESVPSKSVIIIYDQDENSLRFSKLIRRVLLSYEYPVYSFAKNSDISMNDYPDVTHVITIECDSLRVNFKISDRDNNPLEHKFISDTLLLYKMAKFTDIHLTELPKEDETSEQVNLPSDEKYKELGNYLSSPVADLENLKYLHSLIKDNQLDLVANQYQNLLQIKEQEFFAKMGEVSGNVNRSNIIRAAASLEIGTDSSVVIAYDNRFNSKQFARDFASVLLAKNIKVYFTKSAVSLPIFKYALKHFKGNLGVYINGNSLEGSFNGVQLFGAGKFNQSIFNEIKLKEISLASVAPNWVDTLYMNDLYLKEVMQKLKWDNIDIKFGYTPLYGTVGGLFSQLMQQLRFSNFSVSQNENDAKYLFSFEPSPFSKNSLKAGLEMVTSSNYDFLIASSGTGVEFSVTENGYTFRPSEIQLITLAYLLKTRNLENSYFISNRPVTTAIFQMAKNHNVDLLTGINPSKNLIWVLGEDEFISTLLLIEAASYYKKSGLKLIDALYHIYAENNLTLEDSFTLPISAEDKDLVMKYFRMIPIVILKGKVMTRIADFKEKDNKDLIQWVYPGFVVFIDAESKLITVHISVPFKDKSDPDYMDKDNVIDTVVEIKTRINKLMNTALNSKKPK